MAYREKTLRSEIVYEGAIFKIRRDHILATGDKEAVRDILVHRGASVMLAVTKEGKILMVRQWRQAVRDFLLELPAGKIDPGEDALTAANRELREETGYSAGHVEKFMESVPCAGYSEEKLFFYFCTDLTPGKTDFDDTEDLDLFECDPDALIESILNGEITDGKTVSGLLFARAKGLI